nr:hypothetical protein Q903MT_gene4428 [Picea sitchensis]
MGLNGNNEAQTSFLQSENREPRIKKLFTTLMNQFIKGKILPFPDHSVQRDCIRHLTTRREQSETQVFQYRRCYNRDTV